MYSLGVMLFAMIAGFFPLEVASPSDWRYEKMQEAQANNESTCRAIFALYGLTDRLPQKFSPAAMHVVDQLLMIDPARRMKMDELRSTRGSPARPSLRHQPTDRWARRRQCSDRWQRRQCTDRWARRRRRRNHRRRRRQSRGSSGASIWTTRRRGSSCSERDGCLGQGPY